MSALKTVKASTPSQRRPGEPLRVATYNIHKGVRGVGPRKRLEIHNLGLGIEALDADVVCLQEVRLYHQRDALRFERTWLGWPDQGQADFLAPEGYEVAYRTNAVTRHGEHGNALLSRWPIGDVGHHDVSDHRFEQRGLLHVPVWWHGIEVHVVVAHFGLIHSSRVRQVEATDEAASYLVSLLCEYAHPDEAAGSTFGTPLTFQLRDAMAATEMVGIARLVLYRRERAVMLAPHGKGCKECCKIDRDVGQIGGLIGIDGE